MLKSPFLMFLLCIGVALLLADCAGTKGKVNFRNPKSVCMAFYKALSVNDLDKAKQVGTEETKKVMTLLQTLSDAFPDDKQTEEIAKMANLLELLKKAKCEVEDELAKCTICCDEAGDFGPEFLILKKVDKKWLVHLTKEDLKK